MALVDITQVLYLKKLRIKGKVTRFILRLKLNRESSADKQLWLLLSTDFALKPGNLDLYKAALIHKSATTELSAGKKVNNERLEYLGDSIIDSIIADYLFTKFPGENEGFLTKMRSRIVSRQSLNEIALSIGMDKLVITQTNNPLAQKHIFGDALEAFVGAIYLDKGYNKTRAWVISFLISKHVDIPELLSTENDYKSRIIELSQKHKFCIQFSSVERSTPKGENPLFEAKLFLNDKIMGTGFGTSKKEAEQNASMVALERIDIIQLPNHQLKSAEMSCEN